jgi:hypothetical protein
MSKNYKALMLGLVAVRVSEFEFEEQKFFFKDFSIKAGDDCNVHLKRCLGEDGKVQESEESLIEFSQYRNKFLAYSLCDEKGAELFALDEVEKMDFLKVQALFVALSKAKNGQNEAV